MYTNACISKELQKTNVDRGFLAPRNIQNLREPDKERVSFCNEGWSSRVALISKRRRLGSRNRPSDSSNLLYIYSTCPKRLSDMVANIQQSFPRLSAVLTLQFARKSTSTVFLETFHEIILLALIALTRIYERPSD